ncbi:hypothetical protein EHF_0437 [Ehrlichia japonica]|uniref:Uncharacterized protein n=1 Tax=Ehrlichia japonica TaxID=391036 RepID=X5H288_9RICK|nr:hypothetical protein EHF_0437 [Ehrlichia japonica]
MNACFVAITRFGSIIKDKVIPPISADERGMLKILIYIASPKMPNMIDGTDARFVILTSMIEDILFFGMSSLKHIPDVIPMGNANVKHIIIVNIDPISDPIIPVFSGDLELYFVNNASLKDTFILLLSCNFVIIFLYTGWFIFLPLIILLNVVEDLNHMLNLVIFGFLDIKSAKL